MVLSAAQNLGEAAVVYNEEIMWKEKLNEILPLLGHRNWILIVDKSFPLQSTVGTISLNTGDPLTEVLTYTLSRIAATSHVKPIIYMDRELEYMTENLSAGAEELKARMEMIFRQAGYKPDTIPHEEVFGRLEAASKLFQVVILKTECRIPYTSVFLELDCGYWDSDRETTLRAMM